MRSLSTFTVLLLMATLPMLSYCFITDATPVKAPSITNSQNRKSDPPNIMDSNQGLSSEVPLEELNKKLNTPIDAKVKLVLN
ncbi:hypothetical protein BG005_004411 [Podila minutissima]|nr:hypothetical protein BG005_004411 [Podila minutissima]